MTVPNPEWWWYWCYYRELPKRGSDANVAVTDSWCSDLGELPITPWRKFRPQMSKSRLSQCTMHLYMNGWMCWVWGFVGLICTMHYASTSSLPQPSSLSPPLSSPPPPSSPPPSSPPLPSPPSPSWSFLSSASIKFYWSVGCRPSETRWSPSSSSSFPGRGACVISLLFEILRIQDPQIPTNFQDSGSWILWTWLSCW